MKRKTYKRLDIDTFNRVSLELSKENKESYPVIICFPLAYKDARELDKALISALKGKSYDNSSRF